MYNVICNFINCMIISYTIALSKSAYRVVCAAFVLKKYVLYGVNVCSMNEIQACYIHNVVTVMWPSASIFTSSLLRHSQFVRVHEIVKTHQNLDGSSSLDYPGTFHLLFVKYYIFGHATLLANYKLGKYAISDAAYNPLLYVCKQIFTN